MALMRSAALVGITAIVIVFLPKFFETPPPVVTHGFVASGFEEILNVFRENFETGRDSRKGGSAFSVYYQGEKVVDIWGGYADVESQRKWSEDTLSIFFSSTKGVAAICIAMLADRGLLDYNKPVAHYWPEFAQKGKEKVTVRQMMEHKAGLVLAAPPGLSLEVLQDVAKAGKLMAATEPMWVPDGHTHGYHAFTYGPLANELLRRVDPTHRTMGQFFKEEIAEPYGIDFHIGLPLEMNHRVARLMVDDRPVIMQLLDVMSCPKSRKQMWFAIRTDILGRIFENVNEMGNFNVFNDPAYRAIELPSVNGYGTANGLAKLYSILAVGGTDLVTNKTLLSKKWVDTFMDFEQPTMDKSLGLPLSFNHGMSMNDNLVDGIKFFGHPGAGGQDGAADPKHQVAFGFLSRFMTPYFSGEDPRFVKLIQATYKCIKQQKDK